MEYPTGPELAGLAKETGYQGRTIEKMIRLFYILQAIERDEFLRNRLALTGGTALNAFYLDLDRLSLDIDLMSVARPGEVAGAMREEIDEALGRLLKGQCERMRWNPGGDGSRWDVSFGSALGGSSAIKVDVGHFDGRPLFGAARKSSYELGGVIAEGILVIDIRDVIAGKLAAMAQRSKARDIFDALSIAHIMRRMNMDDIRAAFVASVATASRGRQELGVATRGVDPHEACQDLMNCLPSRYFLNLYPHHSRNKDGAVAWYKESVAICRERFGALLELTPGERRFVDGVQNRGEINVDFLGASPELRARIAAWPRLARKCLRVRDDRKSQDASTQDRGAGR